MLNNINDSTMNCGERIMALNKNSSKNLAIMKCKNDMIYQKTKELQTETTKEFEGNTGKFFSVQGKTFNI